MKSSSKFIWKLTLRLEIYINFIVVPLVYYFGKLTGHYNEEGERTLSALSAIVTPLWMIVGTYIRFYILKKIFRKVDESKDLEKVKLQLLNYPRIEAVIIACRWFLGLIVIFFGMYLLGYVEFGRRYTDADDKKPYAYFLDPMMAEIEEFSKRMDIKRPEIVIEPGRSIVGEAGITLYTIGTIKDIEGIRKYVSVDGGMTDNIRPALYQAKYECVIANKASQPSTDLVTISGKCCESGDILIRDAYIPLAERGDILAIFSTGAYGYAMASNYNKNPFPATVLVKEGKSEVIVKRQTYEHMIENEVIPKSLV